MEVQPRQLVIGAFQPFGVKQTNQADEVAKRLAAMREKGELDVPSDVDVTFVPVETNAQSVEQFLETARDLNAEKVLLLGEGGVRLRVESQAHDRGKPRSLLVSAATAFIPDFGETPTLRSSAPTAAMARAGGAKVSDDPGNFYCNYSYHSALRAGLNAVFVHVPAGLFGIGRDPDAAAKSVNSMLGEWYLSDSHPQG